MPEAIEEQHRVLIDEALQHMSASFRFHRWRDQVSVHPEPEIWSFIIAVE